MSSQPGAGTTEPSEKALSTQFLDAFAAVEIFLRSKLERSQGYRSSFYELVDGAAEGSTAVRRYRNELKEYADLRNAIVHERIGNEPIAEPHASTVVNLQKIRDLVTSPPRLLSQPGIAKSVVSCSPTDPVSAAARAMRSGNFSQVPVVDTTIMGLLTAETIVRWLGHSMGDDDIILGADVASVMTHTENRDHWTLLSADASVFDAAELFDSYQRKGSSLDAILLTQNGRSTERLLGIATIFDYPALVG